MEWIKNGFAALVLGAAVSGNCHALTGDHLYRRCANLDDSMEDHAAKCNQLLVDAVMCRWYVLGIADALIEAEKVCPPNRILDQQLAIATKEYLSVHPEYLSMDAAELVEDALIKAYPCK
jgi:hypothetical protein